MSFIVLFCYEKFTVLKKQGTCVGTVLFKFGLPVQVRHICKIWGFHCGEDSYCGGVVCNTV
jgi:hypothetical protein